MAPSTGYLNRIVIGPFWQFTYRISYRELLQCIKHDCSLIMRKR